MPRVTRARSSCIDLGGRRNPALQIPFKSMPQEPEDENRFFVVEKLMAKRKDDDGQDEYLVRWKNYPPKFDTWEPRSELEINCRELVMEFNAKRQDKFASKEVHCICRRQYRFNQGGMIQCFCCLTWFHFTCLQMDMEEANSYLRYFCESCTKLNPDNKSRVKPEKKKTIDGMSLAKALGDHDNINDSTNEI